VTEAITELSMCGWGPYSNEFHSVLWHCWSGDRNSIWPEKRVLLIPKGFLLGQVGEENKGGSSWPRL